MSNEHDTGYLTKAVEDFGDMLKRHMEQEENDRKEILNRLTLLEKDVSVAKWFLKIVKFLAGVVILVATFRWGDIKSLWTHLQ